MRDYKNNKKDGRHARHSQLFVTPENFRSSSRTLTVVRRGSINLFQGVLDIEALKKLKLAPETHAFVCEGRPSLEAGRKTSKMLLSKGITPTVISDNMAGFLFFKGLVKEVYIACQYADKKGALCDMGALILGVLAKEHKVPLKLLMAERRHRFLGDPKAILSFEGQKTAPQNTRGYVPLVEWIPAKYLIGGHTT